MGWENEFWNLNEDKMLIFGIGFFAWARESRRKNSRNKMRNVNTERLNNKTVLKHEQFPSVKNVQKIYYTL